MAVAVDDRGVVLERLAAVVAIERQVRRKDEARLLVGDDRVCALKIEIIIVLRNAKALSFRIQANV